MPITTNHVAALGAVDYDADGAVTTADRAAAQRDVRVLDQHTGTLDTVDHRDGAQLAQTLLRAPAPVRTSLSAGIASACDRLRRGAGQVDWRSATDIVQECDRADSLLKRTPLAAHRRTANGTHVVSREAIENALALAKETSALPRGVLSGGYSALGALELLIRSAEGDGAVAAPAAHWAPLLPDTAPSGPIDRLAHDVLTELRDVGATLYVSRRESTVFRDAGARSRLETALDAADWRANVPEVAARLYVTWPESGPGEIRVPLEELTGISGTALRIQRNGSFRFLRLPDDVWVLDSFTGVRGNWKTGWSSLESAVFADHAPAPYAAWRASFLGASIEESGVLGAWGAIRPLPANRQELADAWGDWLWDHDRAARRDPPSDPDELDRVLERYRRVERLAPELLSLDASGAS